MLGIQEPVMRLLLRRTKSFTNYLINLCVAMDGDFILSVSLAHQHGDCVDGGSL